MCVLNEQGPQPDRNPHGACCTSVPTPPTTPTSPTNPNIPTSARRLSLRLVRGDGDAPLGPAKDHAGKVRSGIARPWKSAQPPSPEEIALAINPDKFPPILSPEQAAELLQIAPNTLYKHVSQGKYKQAVRRGNPLRFWRDRLIQAFFAA